MSKEWAAKFEDLLNTFSDHVFSDGLSGRSTPSPHSDEARAALMAHVERIGDANKMVHPVGEVK